MACLTIIDDDEDFANAVAIVLSDAGHDVEVELSIKSAKKNLSERFPDLIILDVMFPEKATAGFEMARTLKQFDGKFKDIPILILSAINSEFPLGFSSSDIDDNRLPVDDFIEKPVDFDVLKEKVMKLLSRNTE